MPKHHRTQLSLSDKTLSLVTMNRETLIQLHQKGYRLSILDGVLQVQVESISSEMEIWLTQNKADLIREIARVTGKPILEYLDYSTGRYGKNKNYDGVTLNFSHVATSPHTQ